MRVYILYETKNADEYGFSRRDDVVGVYAKRSEAEAVEKIHTQNAKKYKLDYTYCVVPIRGSKRIIRDILTI